MRDTEAKSTSPDVEFFTVKDQISWWICLKTLIPADKSLMRVEEGAWEARGRVPEVSGNHIRGFLTKVEGWGLLQWINPLRWDSAALEGRDGRAVRRVSLSKLRWVFGAGIPAVERESENTAKWGYLRALSQEQDSDNKKSILTRPS